MYKHQIQPEYGDESRMTPRGPGSSKKDTVHKKSLGSRYFSTDREPPDPTAIGPLSWLIASWFRSCGSNTLVLSTCLLHTNSGCGKERRIIIGPW